MGANLSPTFRAEVINNTSDAGTTGNDAGSVTPTITETGTRTVQLTFPATASVADGNAVLLTWSDGNGLPQQIDIEAVRLSFTSDSFEGTAGTGGSGTNVVANPSVTTDILETITIGTTSYAINTGGVDVVTSVSYTHLTLPTNREV